MAPELRDWLLIGTLVIVAWRVLPAGQAVLATIVCAAALWLTFHPVLAANLLREVARLY